MVCLVCTAKNMYPIVMTATTGSSRCSVVDLPVDSIISYVCYILAGISANTFVYLLMNSRFL